MNSTLCELRMHNVRVNACKPIQRHRRARTEQVGAVLERRANEIRRQLDRLADSDRAVRAPARRCRSLGALVVRLILSTVLIAVFAVGSNGCGGDKGRLIRLVLVRSATAAAVRFRVAANLDTKC